MSTSPPPNPAPGPANVPATDTENERFAALHSRRPMRELWASFTWAVRTYLANPWPYIATMLAGVVAALALIVGDLTLTHWWTGASFGIRLFGYDFVVPGKPHVPLYAIVASLVFGLACLVVIVLWFTLVYRFAMASAAGARPSMRTVWPVPWRAVGFTAATLFLWRLTYGLLIVPGLIVSTLYVFAPSLAHLSKAELEGVNLAFAEQNKTTPTKHVTDYDVSSALRRGRSLECALLAVACCTLLFLILEGPDAFPRAKSADELFGPQIAQGLEFPVGLPELLLAMVGTPLVALTTTAFLFHALGRAPHERQ